MQLQKTELHEDFALSPANALACVAERLGKSTRLRIAKKAWQEAASEIQGAGSGSHDYSGFEKGSINYHEELNGDAQAESEQPWFRRWEGAAHRLQFRVNLAPLKGDHELVAQMEDTGGLLLLVPQELEPDRVFVVTSVRGSQAWLMRQDGTLCCYPTRDLAEMLGASGVESGYRIVLCHGGPALAAIPATSSHESAHADGHAAHIAPLSRLLLLLRPDSGDIAVAAVYSLVVAFLSLATPIAAEQLVNVVGFGGLGQPLVVISLLLFAGLMFATFLKTLQVVVAEIIQQRLFVRVVADLAWRLPRVQHKEFDGQHGPELINRFFDVITVQKSAALLVLDGVAVSIQFMVGMLVLAFYHPWFLGLDLLLVTAFGAAVVMLGRGGIRTAIDESLAKYAVAGWLEQIAEFSITFKGAGGHALAAERADELSMSYVEARQRHFRVLLRQTIFVLTMQAVAGSLLLGFGGWLVVQGRLTLGQLVAAELILAIMIGGIAKLGKFTEGFYDLMAAVDKLGHLFDLSTESEWGEIVIANRPIRLEFHNVSAHIQGLGGLSHVNIHFGPGGIHVISGPSGSGKSLMMDLAFGLRTPHSGTVSIDGVAMKSLSTQSIRLRSALLRNLEIFGATVLENVTLGRPSISQSDVRRLLERLELVEEIQSLPDGYNEMLHAEGTPLSFNQAKRLQLARCLAGRPRLLLLDGFLDGFPRNVLDTVFSEFRRISAECTIVIVSNREDVLAYADKKIVWPGSPLLIEAAH